MWYGSGAPFDSVLQVLAVCSVFVVLVAFPVLETKLSGPVNQLRSSDKESSKGAAMFGEMWNATKNVCQGLTGGLLILTRRNELSSSHGLDLGDLSAQLASPPAP